MVRVLVAIDVISGKFRAEILIAVPYLVICLDWLSLLIWTGISFVISKERVKADLVNMQEITYF